MKRLRFVVSLITDENDYQRQQAASAIETATRVGMDLAVLYAKNDPLYQSQQLLEVIQGGGDVDGIIVEPAGRTAFPKVASAAVASGRAWVLLNCEADYLSTLRLNSKVPVFSVSADNREVGRIQGRQLAALLPQGGSVIYIQGPSQSTVTEQRTAGMVGTKPPNVKVRTLKSSNWTEEGGIHAVSSWLRLSTAKHERIDLVQAQNDFLAVGARRAIEQAVDRVGGSLSNLCFLGVDGLPRTGQAWVKQGVLKATIIVPAIAPIALSALYSALRDQSRPAERTLVASVSFPEVKELQPMVGHAASVE